MNVKRLFIESVALGVVLYFILNLTLSSVLLTVAIIAFVEFFFATKEELQTVDNTPQCPCCHHRLSRIHVLSDMIQGIKQKKYVLSCPFCGRPIGLYSLYIKKIAIVGGLALGLFLEMLFVFHLYVWIIPSMIISFGLIAYFLSCLPLDCESKDENDLEDEFKKEKNL